MARQPRAERTRRRILDSAATLFREKGYGTTDLADIVAASGLTKGAFYYHFSSKTDVAVAIIAAYGRKISATVTAHVDPAAPTLTGIIRATFALQALRCSDPSAAIGQQLMQTLHLVSTDSLKIVDRWTETFTELISLVRDAGEVRADIDPADVAQALWIPVLGSELPSSNVDNQPFAQLTKTWRMILRASVPEETEARYEELLADITAEVTRANPQCGRTAVPPPAHKPVPADGDPGPAAR